MESDSVESIASLGRRITTAGAADLWLYLQHNRATVDEAIRLVAACKPKDRRPEAWARAMARDRRLRELLADPRLFAGLRAVALSGDGLGGVS